MSSLPSFEHPPLTEVFLALQHDPLRKAHTSHVGEFLQATGPEWIPQPDVAAVGQTHEPVGATPEWILPGTLDIDIRTGVRLRASRGKRERMLQAENGWLVYNWLEGSGPYIRFEGLRSEFERHVERWQRYVREHELGELRPNLWEVGYVNVFPRGEYWSTLADCSRILPQLVSTEPRSAGELHTLSGKWAYLMGPGVGRLQVFLEHAIHGGAEAREALLLRLIARGPVKEGSMQGYWHGLELGHRTIVTTFAELLSDSMKEKLGYKR